MPRTDVGAATRATYVAFAVERVRVRELGLADPAGQVSGSASIPRELGLLLLAIAAGAVIALPSSGLVGRFGSRRAVGGRRRCSAAPAS